MVVLSNATRTYKIEGISFTPSKQGTQVPESKIEEIKDNFFFKTLCDEGVLSLKVQPKVQGSNSKANENKTTGSNSKAK